MKAPFAKCVGKDGFQSKGHVPTAVVRSKCIVSEVTGLKVAANDFADADDTGKVTTVGSNPVSNVCRGLEAPEPARESLRRAWRRDPETMQFTASFHGSQKLTLTLHRGFLQGDLHGL